MSTVVTVPVDRRIPRPMWAVGTPSCCYACAHPGCIEKRRRSGLPCALCARYITPGQLFYVTSVDEQERVVEHVHVSCAERPR